MPRKLVAGNWKMNGLRASMAELDTMLEGATGAGCDVLVCPPATLLTMFNWRVGSSKTGGALAIGAQDCHPAEKGAHTGDISAEMLADAGATYVIVGHSERRVDAHPDCAVDDDGEAGVAERDAGAAEHAANLDRVEGGKEVAEMRPVLFGDGHDAGRVSRRPAAR